MRVNICLPNSFKLMQVPETIEMLLFLYDLSGGFRGFVVKYLLILSFLKVFC